MRAGFWVWLALVAAVTMLPWRFVGHPHWAAIDWVPFVGRSSTAMAWIRDAPLNLLLFLPLGFLVVDEPRHTAVFRAATLGLAVSLAAESFQVFCHGRFPSINDVIVNVSGAAIGAWLARHVRAAPSVRERRAGRGGDGGAAHRP